MKFISYVIEQTFLFALPNNDIRKHRLWKRRNKDCIPSIASCFVSCARVYRVYTYWPCDNPKIKGVATLRSRKCFCFIKLHRFFLLPTPSLENVMLWGKEIQLGKTCCNTQLFIIRLLISKLCLLTVPFLKTKSLLYFH